VTSAGVSCLAGVLRSVDLSFGVFGMVGRRYIEMVRDDGRNQEGLDLVAQAVTGDDGPD
jgi:hypothetical protein